MKRIIVNKEEFDTYVNQLKQNETIVDFDKDITYPQLADREAMAFMAGYITAAKTLNANLNKAHMSDLVEEANR